MHLRPLSLLSIVTFAWACGGQSLATSDGGESGEGGTSTGGTNTGGTGAGGTKGGTGGTGAGGTTGGSNTGGTGAGGTTGGTGAGGAGGSGAVGATGGTSTGGTGAGGTTGGTGAGGAGGSGGSCLAFPTCAPGEVQIPGPDYCFAGTPCYQVSICGATIWCAVPPPCDAIPVCDEADTELTGPCPPDGSCYSRTVCETTIWCLDRCNPNTEPNRDYLLKECAPGDMWSCPPNTQSFVNDCGCGCEQDSTCPLTFYCQRAPIPMDAASGAELPNPGGGNTGVALPPPCDEAELARCPYSETAF